MDSSCPLTVFFLTFRPMQKKWLPLLLPHLIAVVVFLLIAVIYCKPVFEHKVLQQADVTQYKAMARNSFAYKEKHGVFPLWTQGMFSGMPAYQIAIDVQPFATAAGTPISTTRRLRSSEPTTSFVVFHYPRATTRSGLDFTRLPTMPE